MIAMTRYQNLLKAGLVISLTMFTAIAYVNCNETSAEDAMEVEYVTGPVRLADHMTEQGAGEPETFTVTAYLAIDEYENRFHGITFTGVPAKPYHTIAVDPKVIPLGSRVYVEGLGWWKAEDTGNMIKGNILDICVSNRDEAKEWGRRKRRVWYLTPEQLTGNANKTQEKAELASAEVSNIG